MKGFKPTGYGPSAGFKFPASFGFTGSTGAYTNVAPYVRMKPRAFKDGGYVSKTVGDAGHALVQRDRPYTNEDQQSGGRSPLRRGFKKGGKMRKARGGPVRGALSSMVGKAKQQQMMKAPKPIPATGMKGKFAAADGGRVARGSSAKSFTESVKDIPELMKSVVTNIKQGMSRGQRTVEGTSESVSERVDRDVAGKTMASNYSRGGKAKRMGYKDGGYIATDWGNADYGVQPLAQAKKHSQAGLREIKARVDKMDRFGKSTSYERRKAQSQADDITSPNHRINLRTTKDVKPLYAKGGAVSRGEAKKIAERTVGEHVKYPAPRGHKGLGAMCK